jgi:hypothetical protein
LRGEVGFETILAMRGTPVVAAALVAACYAPQPQPGAPCTVDEDCPTPLVCTPRGTCDRDRAGIAPSDAPPDLPEVDGCAPAAEICGNGVDDDCAGGDLACAANDKPDGAIDVTAGGTFTGDARLATDDVDANGCGGAGGRDLFFRVVLTAPQVYYFDTFNASYDTVIRVYRKSCAAVGAGEGADACAEGSCGGGKSQVAASLPAGESCIVVDERDAAQASGALELLVVRGGRDGMPLARGVQVYTGDTCSATNASEPLDQNCDGPGSNGRDHAFFFTTCPGETLRLDADVCPTPSWDPVLYVKRVNGNQIGCNDDSACGHGPRLTDVTISNSTLYFLFLDGFAAQECGPYSLDTNLRL